MDFSYIFRYNKRKCRFLFLERDVKNNMYERSAIVLERYMEKIFEFNKTNNLKSNFDNFKELLDEIENYQILAEKEGKVIQEFDDTVKKIEDIQNKQDKLYKENQKLEEMRNQLFLDLGEDSKILDNKFKKVEKSLEQNNEKLKEFREEFIKYLSDFSVRQKERNKCEKARRVGEANHLSYIKKMQEDFNAINVKDVVKLKEFINSEKELVKNELNDIMTKNGKNEKIGFNQDILKVAIKARINIAEKEAECYVLIYEKMKKLLNDIEADNLKINKYKKASRDAGVKLAFLDAEKEYIFGLLDYERMTIIAGSRQHKKKMEEACQNFELDMIQIHNLYELILREIANKSTKKAYKELYNKTYLKNIEDKEKNFEEEVNNIKINMGTVINSNYWRIDGIKNVYNVFQEQVSEKFEKDLSGFQLEEIDEEILEKPKQDQKKNSKKQIIEEDLQEEDYDDEEYDEDYYEEDEYEDDEDIEEYEDEYDDEYEEDEYEDDYDDEYEDDEEEYYDDDEYDDENYEDDEEYEEDEYEDEWLDDIEEHNKKAKTKNSKTNQKNKNDIKEIDDDDWEKEIMQQLNRKRNSKNNRKQNTNIFGKLFKDKKEKGNKKSNKK